MNCLCGNEMDVINYRYSNDNKNKYIYYCYKCGRAFNEGDGDWFEHEGLKE